MRKISNKSPQKNSLEHKMIFRKFLFLFGFIQTERPNVILLVTDDFGMGDFQERVLNQAKNLIHGMEKNSLFFQFSIRP